MQPSWTCLCLGAALVLAVSPAHAAKPDPGVIERTVQAHVRAADQAAQQNRESVEAMQTLTADLDGDGKEEIVLLTTLLGPTYWGYAVTVFSDRGKGYVVAAESTDALGMVDSISAKDGTVLVKAKWPAANDPICCPTLEKTTPYQLRGGKLLQAGKAR